LCIKLRPRLVPGKQCYHSQIHIIRIWITHQVTGQWQVMFSFRPNTHYKTEISLCTLKIQRFFYALSQIFNYTSKPKYNIWLPFAFSLVVCAWLSRPLFFGTRYRSRALKRDI